MGSQPDSTAFEVVTTTLTMVVDGYLYPPYESPTITTIVIATLVVPLTSSLSHFTPTTSIETIPSSTSTTTSSTGKSKTIPPGAVAGAVLGGLAFGIIIALVIVFFLRHLRNRSRNPANVFVAGAAADDQKERLMAKLTDVEAERAQLRTYLQVTDAQDPQDIADSFNHLNVSIRNLGITTANHILKAAQPKSSWTTKNASNMEQLQQVLAGATGLLLSPKSAGRSPKDFLPEAFRFIINTVLLEELFRTFHPHVPKNENDLILYAYQQVRNRDGQRLAARWRCSTYSAIDSRFPPTAGQEWAKHFADDVARRFATVVSSLFGDGEQNALPDRLHDSLTTVGRDAYNWNRTTKATFHALDFRPVVFTSADPFDPVSMQLYNHKPKESPLRTIICGVSMALISTSVTASEEGVKEDLVWQVKAEVVTEGFF